MAASPRPRQVRESVRGQRNRIQLSAPCDREHAGADRRAGRSQGQVAHEDDAERAVRAGLAVIEAVTAIAGPQPLSVRVGISTGIVVISETGSGDPSIPSSAVGDTPHIAARLQAIAAPNSVVIAEV